MNALISHLRAPQTLRSRVVRLLVVRIGAFATFAAVLLVGQVMSVRPSAAMVSPSESTVPTWSAAEALRNPGCVAADAWRAGAIPSAVIGFAAGERAWRRFDFASTWNLNHDRVDTNDIWVLAICA